MTDLISRQAAIDLFPNDALEWDTKGGYVAPHTVRRMIEELPSVDAVPVRHGRWISRPAPSNSYCGYLICSNCGEEVSDADEYNYCPHCGAKMEVEHEAD